MAVPKMTKGVQKNRAQKLANQFKRDFHVLYTEGIAGYLTYHVIDEVPKHLQYCEVVHVVSPNMKGDV